MDTAELTMTQRRGAIPQRPTNFAHTPIVQRVHIIVNTAVRLSKFAEISGPVGVGKTTAAAESARRLGSNAVYVLMQDAPSVKAAMAIIWESMTQTEAIGTEMRIKDSILMHLLNNKVTLLIDDAHYVSTRGLRVLVHIWNSLDAIRGYGVPIILIGNNLNTTLANVPEIQSRGGSRYEVPPLGGDTLYDTLTSLEPRAAVTERALLRNLDRGYFHGQLRQWVTFFDVVRMAGPSDPGTPITPHEIRSALLRQGWDQ